MAHIEELQLLMSPPAHIHTLFPHPRADQAQPRLKTIEDFICSPKKLKKKSVLIVIYCRLSLFQNWSCSKNIKTNKKFTNFNWKHRWLYICLYIPYTRLIFRSNSKRMTDLLLHLNRNDKSEINSITVKYMYVYSSIIVFFGFVV